MGLGDESLAELFEQYKDEVRETIGILDSELVAIEQDPSNSEVIFSIFRHLHSLKGSSKMFNVDNLGHIAHKLEDLMQQIDKDNTLLGKNPRIVDLLFKGNDIFREIIARLETDIGFVNLTPEHAAFVEEISHQVDLIERKDTGLIQAGQDILEELESLLPSLEEVETERLRRSMDELASQIEQMTLTGGVGNVRYTYNQVDLTGFLAEYESGLDKFKKEKYNDQDIAGFFKNAEAMLQALFAVAEEDIMNLLGDLNDGLEMYEEKSLEIDAMLIEFFSLTLADLKECLKVESSGPVVDLAPIASVPTEGKPQAAPKAPPPSQIKTIRVDEGKIDQFLDSVGKLITQSEILNHLQFSFKGAGINPSLVRDFAAVNRTISNDIVNLQRSIMEVRQVEMDNILKKFPRLVRDISHKIGKEVELEIEGERTPIDKSLLDDVEAALIHIVRNAIDHGLESPDEREALGKPRRGVIRVHVVQEEASVLVQVSDDGRGLDLDAVRRRAVDKGLISTDESDSLDSKDIENLVFRSGLTTKEEATDISGRGVGLDVVLSNIRKWNGEVTLDSQPGQGLAILLRIPITNTLLTKEALLIKLGGSTFCMPLEYVVEIVTVAASRIHHHRDRAVFTHRNQVISIIDLRQMLGIATPDGSKPSRTFIILRGKTDNRRSILADEIVGQQKIVIKEFEIDAFRRLPYYQGLTLMGDGRVVLILDAEKIVEQVGS